MKIGMYGGTFDPIHLAHLVIAEYALSELDLDQLVFVPSYTPPHKRSKKISPPEHRLNMLKLAIENHPQFAVCEFELDKGGTSFTIDTIHYLQQHYYLLHDDLFVIIGADNLVDFHRWKDPDLILQNARIAVAGRPSYETTNSVYTDFIYLDTPLLDISASVIRDRIRQHKSVRYLVPPSVEHYIREHHLYV